MRCVVSIIRTLTWPLCWWLVGLVELSKLEKQIWTGFAKVKMEVRARTTPRFVGRPGAAKPHQSGSTSRRATGIFSSFELCDNCDCTKLVIPYLTLTSITKWLEVVALVSVSLTQSRIR
jgi:hypothetical protein